MVQNWSILDERVSLMTNKMHYELGICYAVHVTLLRMTTEWE